MGVIGGATGVFLLFWIILFAMVVHDEKRGVPLGQQPGYRTWGLVVLTFMLGRSAYVFVDVAMCVLGVRA